MISARDLEAIRQIALHRFVTQPQIEELLLSGDVLTPRSRQVIAWRVLGRLQRAGYVRSTSRQIGGFAGGSSCPAYFLTAGGLRVAATQFADLPQRRPVQRAAFLAAHSLMTTDVELAFRRFARAHDGHELEVWEADWQISLRLGDRAVVPDARLVYRAGRLRLHCFVEADLGTEGSRFFARKLTRYLEAYRAGVWRSFLKIWPRIFVVTLTEGRAASLHAAASAALGSAFGPLLSVYFCSVGALRMHGLRAPCLTVGEKEPTPFAADADLATRAEDAAPSAAPTDAGTLERGRSGAGRGNDEQPRASSEVDGLA